MTAGANNGHPSPITAADVRLVGKLLKPHGICGEITALLTADVDLEELSCVLLCIDGIFVPFFLSSVRPKSSETDLLTIDGIDSEVDAARLCPCDLYALATEMPDDSGADGFYASDLVGYEVLADGVPFGKITGIDDTTANYLFIIETPAGETRLIPVADEFIVALDPEARTIGLELPEGLADL